MRGRERLGALGMAVEERGPPHRREGLRRQLEMDVSLAAAADDPDRLERPLGERPDAQDARRRSAHLRDPGRVHHGEWPAAAGLRQQEEAVDVWEAGLLVARVARDPLQPDGVGVREVGRHRVNERVLTRVHADLRRHLDGARPLRAEHALEDVHDLGTAESDLLDVRPAQVANAVGGHRRSLVTPR
jgi:hypothetical protein